MAAGDGHGTHQRRLLLQVMAHVPEFSDFPTFRLSDCLAEATRILQLLSGICEKNLRVAVA